MSAHPETEMSPEEYLAFERQAVEKHEYLDGRVLAMAPANEAHNLIVVNLVCELGTQLRGKQCEVLCCQMRVRVAEGGPFVYPDVLVVRGRAAVADAEKDNLLNPGVIFEVLSAATEGNDRGWKASHYRQLASLAEYVLVAQDLPHVEHYVRQPDGTWLFREHWGLGETLRLPSIGCEIPLATIYDRVDFRPDAVARSRMPVPKPG